MAKERDEIEHAGFVNLPRATSEPLPEGTDILRLMRKVYGSKSRYTTPDPDREQSRRNRDILNQTLGREE